MLGVIVLLWVEILILGKGPTGGSDDTAVTAETEYSIYFIEDGQKIFA